MKEHTSAVRALLEIADAYREEWVDGYDDPRPVTDALWEIAEALSMPVLCELDDSDDFLEEEVPPRDAPS